MSRSRSFFSAVSVYVIAVLFFAGFAAQVEAQNRRSEREVRDIVRSLKSKIDDFQYNLNYRLRSNSAEPDEVIAIENNLRDLDGRINEFETNLDRRRENVSDVSRILDAARRISDYLNANPQPRRIENDWTETNALLNRLAALYNIRPGTNQRNSSYGNNSPDFGNTAGNYSNNFGLTGTYRLDAARSENASEIVAGSDVQSEEARRDLENKLQSPEQIAIDVRGNQVVLASSNSAPISFVADGTTKTENAGGKTIRVRAALRGQELIVSSIGGDSDYTVTFVSTDNGRTLKVTRRITTDYLNETVFADSFYSKSDAVARLGINGNSAPNQTTSNYPADDDAGFSSNSPDDQGGAGNSQNNPNNRSNNNYPTVSNGRTGTYVVPNGTIVSGVLENEISTKVSQNNDRFRLTVQSPDEFRGATIEGYLSGINRSGQVSGRSNITFNFERIILRGGQSYDFNGFLQSVTDRDGKNVRVDAEGTAKGDNQTNETVKRGGIGAGLGAIIGAIAGGGKGAAIGAIIGGSAGAGSVIVQGKDDLELRQGSSITVQASSPLR